MRHELLCLTTLLSHCALIDNCQSLADVIVYHLYCSRRAMPASRLREIVYEFVSYGFNPFDSGLSPVAKIQMKSVISKCDSCL